MKKTKLKKIVTEPEQIADHIAEKLIQILEKQAPVQKIQNTHILSVLVGAVGLALFFVGIEKVFINLPGPTSMLVGLSLLIISGALLKKL